MKTTGSRRLMKRAREILPGGVNSPVRAFGGVGGQARFIERGSGARVEDVDGNRYLDFVCSWGAIIAGHAHPVIVEAVKDALGGGTSFGAPTEREVALAERVAECVPSVEMLRFVNSGTEATMSALRVARGATGRERIIKFEGGYHGHSDALLAAAGSGIATFGVPDSAGVTRGAAADTVALPYNDLARVRQAFDTFPDQIAAVLVEPVAANMGMVAPVTGFLAGLRHLCDAHGAVLVFDEVITGFRLGLGGAQARFGVVADLCCFGKVIGGGLPVGAYGGKRALMEQVAPAGEIYQAGTLAGNPLAMAAGLAALDLVRRDGVYELLEAKGRRLVQGLGALADEAGIPFCADAMGGLFGFFFHGGPVTNFRDAREADHKRFKSFFHAMLDAGIHLAPSPYEAGFLTTAHTDSDIDETLEAARRAFRKA